MTDSQAALATAQEHMREERWGAAAAVLGPFAGDESLRFTLNVCRNLHALRARRPETYAAVIAATGSDLYTIGASASGHPTIFQRQPSGSLLSLSPQNRPVASLTSIFAAIKDDYQLGRPLAVLGIGDGYLLKSCALNPPTMRFDARQPIYLFEPDGQNALACLTLHDYTGPQGPIDDERFHWFVGPNYADQARASLLDDTYNAPPAIDVGQSPAVAQIAQVVKALLGELTSMHVATQRRVDAYYAALPQARWAEAYAESPARKPRVLLITTQLSSVLQYSTRDAAEGFEAVGWEALVFVEPKPHHVVTLTRFIQHLEEFKPDLIFQIDHLRHEWRGAIPPALPFACWIQDHLPNLTTTAAGTAITARDFVLVGMPAMYVERYGYPAGQCVELTKLTRLPSRPATWTSDGDDLVYVSSASQQPRGMAASLVEQFGSSREAATLVAAACDDQIARYARGDSLATLRRVADAFDGVEARLGLKLEDADVRRQVIDALFDRMSNLLYRQQGLRWAANVADKLGLTLSVYGPGWDKHPQFARFARGVIKYGPDLEALTRSAKINLTMEPFLSVSHQRLLDGLAAGGFFLVRYHPSNTLYPELLDFITAHAPQAETTQQLRSQAARRGQSGACDALLARCECLDGHGDVVAIVRGGERAGVLRVGKPTLPSLPLVSFASEFDLEGRVKAFAAEESSRRRVADRQRVSVEERLSYAAGMSRVARFVAASIRAERNAQAA